MPFNVNTNMSSMTAQLNTSKTESSIGKSIQRLSSGLRVNGAADDAAGLAIAKNMAKQVSGYEVNIRNANDAVSLLQVAEGGMDEIGNMLQRMKDLALQSANGTNTQAQRSNLDAEFQALIGEIDRVVNTTTFNGQTLLDGSINATQFQVDEGTSSNDKIAVTINDISTTALSDTAGVSRGSSIISGDTFSANDTVTITYGGSSTIQFGVTTTTSVEDFVNAVNSYADTTNLTASLSGNSVVFYNSDSTNDASLTSGSSVDLGGFSDFFNDGSGVTVANGNSNLFNADISGANADNADDAIRILDAAITKITTERATIGASQNRFDSSINNLNNKIVNVSAAMGRIMDADFAKETAEFSKSQILQQAGVSMMAQAKSLPNQLLSLLQ